MAETSTPVQIVPGGAPVDVVSFADGKLRQIFVIGDPTTQASFANILNSRLLVDNSGVTQPISGAVSVSNFPASQAITGSVVVNNPYNGDVADRTTRLLGHVQVDNFPAAFAISSGSVTITNFPATQTVAGTVAVSNMYAGDVTDRSARLLGHVTVDNQISTTGLALDATFAKDVDGGIKVHVQNPSSGAAGLTDTQLRATPVPVSGTVAISNPTTNPETGLAKQVTQTDGTQKTQVTSLPALPAGANAIGSVSVSNLPATQPVSGTVTSNIGTTNGLALDATLTGGTAKAINRGGAKGTTTAADVTSVSVDANTQALHTSVTNFPATQPVSIASMPITPVTGTFFQATQPVSGPLTDTQLRASAPAVRDDYQAGQVLADQSGANAVLTFTFAQVVNQVWINADGGAASTAVCRADPFGGTPSSVLGIPVYNQAATPLLVNATLVKIYAPSGQVVSVWGYYRT